MKTIYYVWKRNDGYVHASANRMPQGWKTPSGEVTFELLKTFDDWSRECVEYIMLQRELAGCGMI